MEGIRHRPLEPDKEMPFLAFNLLHFADDETAKEYEEEIGKWWPELLFFIGRITGGGPDCPIPDNPISQKFTHILIWRYHDFAEYRRTLADYASSLEESSKQEGDWPGYLQDVGWGFWAVDDRDPLLQERGLEGWNTRLVSQALLAPGLANEERRAASREAGFQALKDGVAE